VQNVQLHCSAQAVQRRIPSPDFDDNSTTGADVSRILEGLTLPRGLVVGSGDGWRPKPDQPLEHRRKPGARRYVFQGRPKSTKSLEV